MKLKSVFSPRGYRVLWLKISQASALFLSLASRMLVRITDTSISLGECPGELKWRPTGSSVFADVERKWSRNLSPKRLPVSPM